METLRVWVFEAGKGLSTPLRQTLIVGQAAALRERAREEAAGFVVIITLERE